MYIKDWKKNVLTVPNLLSLFRLMLIPVYMAVYLQAEEPFEFYTAGLILAASCLTDAIDGFIARRYNQITTLGKILDPLADKITQFTLILCLSLKYPMLRQVMLLFILKEIFQIAAGLIHLHKGKILPGALYAGKLCTTVLFTSLTALVLFPTMANGWVFCISLVDGFFLVVSFLSYIFAYFGTESRLQDLNPKPE